MLISFFVIGVISWTYCDLHEWNNRIYDDVNVSEMITVITATSAIRSHPKVDLLYEAQASLYLVPALAMCKKIIVFDGLASNQQHLNDQYEQYKKNVIELTKSDPYFANTELVFCEKWGHLSGAIQEAMKHVETSFVFMHQHDLVLLKEFDLNGVIASMEANSSIKYVHLCPWPNTKANWWFGSVNDQIDGIHFVPFLRGYGWSDQCHVSTKKYYTDLILPLCNHTFMENVCHHKVKSMGQKGQEVFGVFLYGSWEDGLFNKHTNGRNTK